MKNPLSGARYANVAATLALVVALGGTSYAAATIGTGDIKDNAVTSAKIKNKNVKTADLKGSAVNSAKIKNNGVRDKDVADIKMKNLTLLNGWVPYAPLSLSAQYGRDASGVVHLRGGISQGGGFNAAIAVLPPGYRPSETTYVSTNLVSGTGPARLIITTDGLIQVQATAPATNANAQGFTSLTATFVP
jgi:hypothetical protein